jgi:hypothetical protein
MDKLTQALLSGIKQALQEAGEQRLFRSGKLPGVFPSKTGLAAEAAAQALRDGLLEIIRQDTKGKVTTEWVRVTPRAVEFVHKHESPLQALHSLHDEISALGQALAIQAEAAKRQIDLLGQRIREALERVEAGGPKSGAAAADAVVWGPNVVEYLDKRATNGMANPCALPELFEAIHDKQPELTLAEFHTGLRRLQDRGAVRLVAHQVSETLPAPEYALLDGAATFYYVSK